MTHNELIEYARSLDLEAFVYRHYSPALRAFVIEARMLTIKGEIITRFTINDKMDQMAYRDALAPCENSLHQFTTWRKYP